MKRYLYILLFVGLTKYTNAACPQLYDYLGNLSGLPYWINCTGGSYNLNFQSNSSWGAYTIDWGDGSPNFVGGSYVANTIVAHNYAATIDTFIVTITIPTNTCVMTGVVVMEKPVNASIQIPIGGITTICAPKSISFKNNSTDVSETTKFTWDFGDGSPILSFDYLNAGQILSHNYLKGTVSCQTAVTLRAKNYCNNLPTIAVFNPIQIYDIDVANITPSRFVSCWPDNVFTFNNTTNRNCVPEGNTFQRQERWNFGNYWGLGHDSIINWRPWPPTFPITIAYPSVGTYAIQLLDSNLCGVDTQIIQVSIVNPPTAGLIAPVIPLCQSTPITFTNTSTPGYLYRWNFGDGGGFVSRPFGPQSHSYSTFGTFTVSVVASLGAIGGACSDTERVVITIFPSPNALFTATPSQGCVRISNAVFTDLSTSAISWNWNFGNGNTFNGLLPPSQNYTAIGNYVASLTVTAASTCVKTFTLPITVYPKPVAAFIPTTACVGSSASFIDNTPVIPGNPITSWEWDFGDASPTATSTVQSPTHTYTVQNTFTVQLIVNTAFCGDTATQIIVINTKPTADFTFTPASGCPNLLVNFTNTSLNSSIYNWNFGNLSTSTLTNTTSSFTNTLSVNRNYTVTLTASTPLGCSDTKTAVVSVFPNPKTIFNTNAVAGCSPVVATFTNSSTGAVNYDWKFGDGTSNLTSTLSVLSHTFTNATLLIQTYTVQLISTSNNGCKDSAKLTVTAYPQPIFNFTMLPNSGCTPLSISFPPLLGAVSYTWDYGDGSPLSNLPNPTHTFSNTTISTITYTITLIVSNAFSCIDTTFGYPVIFPKPVPNFVLTPTIGCSPLAVSFTNTSSNSSSNLWRFGDGFTDNSLNTNHAYVNPSSASNQTFSCTLIANTSNGCIDSITKSVLLLFRPKANFTVDTPGCSPKTLNFLNTSSGAFSYKWNFGTTTFTTTNAINQYVNNTNATIIRTVQLIATSVNNCIDTLTVPINIYPKPEYTIVAQPDSGCTALNVNFPNILGVKSYEWDFGNGSGSNSGNANSIFYNTSPSTKTFTVKLIATNDYGCKDTATKIITVFAKPKALFQANPNTVFIPTNPINCSNLSTGAISYDWDFGDLKKSTEVNPSHFYQSVGIYQIKLVATNERGCKDTFELPSKINALLESSIEMPNAFSPNPNAANGGVYNPNDLNNDVFRPVLSGIEKYELNIFSRWGELLFVSKDINIGWDGYYKGKLCVQDVYVWKIIAITYDNKRINKAGDVLLLR
ncbi:MAG: PKD domain-containing protein [Bacteroidota bacterium]